MKLSFSFDIYIHILEKNSKNENAYICLSWSLQNKRGKGKLGLYRRNSQA